MPTASLPMYNLPEMRPANALFWKAMRELLAASGLRDLPETLDFERPAVPEQIGPEVLFSQTCGYPLETIFSGQAIRLGTPSYDVPGCDGPTHCGLFVVPAGSSAEELSRPGRRGILVEQPPFQFRHEPAASRAGRNRPRSPLFFAGDRDREPAGKSRSHLTRRGRRHFG